MGGELQVSSSGRGSEFQFTLPFAVATSTSSGISSAGATATSTGEDAEPPRTLVAEGPAPAFAAPSGRVNNAVERNGEQMAAAAPAPPIDIDRFRLLMREAGVESVVEAALVTFRRDAPVRLEQLRHSLTSGDPNRIDMAARALKAPASNVHATRLAELLIRMETCAEESNVAGARALMPETERALEAAMAYLDAYQF
jgi:HPt (histidine-containing phosphotransfer) domain-containing protein